MSRYKNKRSQERAMAAKKRDRRNMVVIIVVSGLGIFALCVVFLFAPSPSRLPSDPQNRNIADHYEQAARVINGYQIGSTTTRELSDGNTWIQVLPDLVGAYGIVDYSKRETENGTYETYWIGCYEIGGHVLRKWSLRFRNGILEAKDTL